MNGKAKSFGMMSGMVLCWSVFYAVSKYLVDMTGSPFVAGFLIRCFALVFLSLQLLAEGFFRRLFRGRHVIILVSIGIFGFLLDLFATPGYAGGSLSTGTALLKTDVLMVNLVSVMLYREKLYASDWVGTFVMLLGVLLVLGIDFRHMQINLTDIFFILSAICVTANAFLIKRAQNTHGENADSISYYNNAVVLILFALSSCVSGDMDLHLLRGLGSKLVWLALLGGFAQTGIYFFYYRNLKTHEVWIVKLYLLLMPVVSCFIGVLFLNETLGLTKLLGILIVLFGAGIILLRSRINAHAAG